MPIPLVGLYRSAQLGVELGGYAAKAVLNGWKVYQALDNRDEIADATQRATDIINKLNSFTNAHNSAICEWSYEDFSREMFPAAIQTYLDAFMALQECVDAGWSYGNPIGYVPSFYRQRILDRNFYNFTRKEWQAARAVVLPCAWIPEAKEPSKLHDRLISIGEKLVVGVVIALLTVYLTRKYKK